MLGERLLHYEIIDGRHLIVNDRTQPSAPLSLFSRSLDTGEKQPFVKLPCSTHRPTTRAAS